MSTRRSDPRATAEAAFRKVTASKPEGPVFLKRAAPGAREQVTLRIDSDVLEHFQADGAGWQDRINAALRKASGL